MSYQISLKAARVNANLTQKEVASRLSVSNKTIINWETGKSSPRADQLRTLCEYYQIPIDFIFLPGRFAYSKHSA